MPETSTEPAASDPRPGDEAPGDQPSGDPGAGGGEGNPPPSSSSSLLEVSPGRIAVGRINGIWGLKGHVKVTPLSSNPERLTEGAVVFVLGRLTKILEVVSPQGYPIVRFQGYPDRTAAERLRDTLIEIDETDLPPLPEGEYYVDDLVGLDVVTTEGEPVGQLTEVLGTGANDVYVVARPGKRDALIPAIDGVLISVDLAEHRMVIDAVPGLLE